jgi:hypothetical protein
MRDTGRFEVVGVLFVSDNQPNARLSAVVS